MAIADYDDEKIEKLVDEIQFNTLLLVLIAKMIKRTGMVIDDVILKLNDQELKSIDTKVFYEYDYSDEDIEVYNRINNHLHTVFNISGLTYAEKQALLNMTLISIYGIQTEEFINACDEETITDRIISDLINQGWIENNNENISLHSIVSDVISEQNIEKEDSYYSLARYLQDQCDVDETTHITILQKALAIAKQLDRRYKFEDDEAQAIAAYLLGSIYLSLYRPKDAEKCLQKAVESMKAAGCEADLPFVYNKLGEYEAKFGTNTRAIAYFNEAIEIAKELCDSDEESCESYYGDIGDAILGIAECYENNKELEKSVQQYKRLLEHIIKHDLDYTEGVIKDIIRLSEELGSQDDVDYYSSLLSDHGEDSQPEESYEEIISTQLNSGDFSKARQEYEKMLNEIREELGEESPYYKDIAKYRWIYYLLNGEEAEAERIIAEDLAFIEKSYGNQSMEMADYLSMLSFEMIDRARFEYGIELAERAITICEYNNQEQSYVYTKSKMDLISANVALGDFYSAGEIAKDLDLGCYSGSDYLSDIIRSVGMVYLELGYYDEIVDLSNRVINSKKIDRLSRVLAFEILLVYYERKGQIDKAEQCLSDVKQQIDELVTLDYAKSYLLIYYRFSARIRSRKKDNDSAVLILSEAINLFDDKYSYTLLFCYQDRGVYYTYLNELIKADQDFEKCSEIVKRFNLSPRVNLLIFNNVALVHYKKEEYAEAEKYYDLILEIQPDIITSPTNYTEAMICQNYGWIKYNMGDSDIAERLIQSAIIFYEGNDFSESTEYYTAKYNLSLIYTSQNRHEENLSLLLDLYDNIERINECSCSTEIHVSTGIVLGLLVCDKEQEAYNFALDEDKKFERKYGKKSIERIDYLQRISGVFKYCGYEDAFEFLERARKLIKKAKLECSVIQASQLNYVGVAFLDLYEDFGNAKRYLSEAKALLEKLGEQENPLYNLVCENLKQCEEKTMDDLIRRMAESFTDDN